MVIRSKNLGAFDLERANPTDGVPAQAHDLYGPGKVRVFQANSLGYNTVLGNAHGRADEAMAIRTVLETRHCDAILLVGDTSDHPRLVDDLRTTAVPLVAMWQGVALPGICTVNVDNQAGTDALLNHLASLGHRRIAFIAAAGRQGDIY